jgi:two-component system response regulator FlrC
MDILPLAAHVLQQHGTPGLPYRITDEARRRLLAYHWPGNVRELGNVIQRALVLCPDRTLTEDHLLFDDDVFVEQAVGMPAHPAMSTGTSVVRPSMERADAGLSAASTVMDGAAAGMIRETSVMPMPGTASGLVGSTFVDEPSPSAGDGVSLPGTAARVIPGVHAEPPAVAGLQWAVRHSELRVILDAIRSTSSREAAARLLGISPRTLRYKLAQMRDLGMMTAEAAN